jgi:hypothetical protein
MNETQDTIFIHNIVPAELGGVIAVRVIEGPMLEPAFDVDPDDARMPCPPTGTFQSIGGIDCPFAVGQYGEAPADFLHPRLNGRKCTKGDDEDTGIKFHKFVLARAQLCGMFTAGDSTQVAEKDQEDLVAVFQDLAEGDDFAFSGGEGEVGGGGVEFEGHWRLND